MNNLETVRNGIVKGLHEFTGAAVVPSDTTDRRPTLPYITYKIISAANNAGTFSLVDADIPSESSCFEHDIMTTRREQPTFNLSVNTYSDCEITAYGLACAARDWFSFHGDLLFVALNIVVVSAGNISDRAQQIVDDYENRYGFDVKIRAARGINRRVETIEQHNFDSLINRPFEERRASNGTT